MSGVTGWGWGLYRDTDRRRWQQEEAVCTPCQCRLQPPLRCTLSSPDPTLPWTLESPHTGLDSAANSGEETSLVLPLWPPWTAESRAQARTVPGCPACPCCSEARPRASVDSPELLGQQARSDRTQVRAGVAPRLPQPLPGGSGGGTGCGCRPLPSTALFTAGPGGPGLWGPSGTRRGAKPPPKLHVAGSRPSPAELGKGQSRVWDSGPGHRGPGSP